MAQKKHKDTDIAIVGMSCVFPGATNIDHYWSNLVNGVDSITEAPANRIDPLYFQQGEEPAYDRFYCNRGGFLQIPIMDPMKFGFLPIAAKGMEPEHLLMMKLAYEALEDAGVYEKNISVENCGVIIGKGNFGNLSSMRNMDIVNTSVQVAEVVKSCLPDISQKDLEKIRKAYQAQKGTIKPDTAIALMPNLIAALITNKMNMHGPSYTVDGACASSTIALSHASELLVSGQCDIVLAAGIHLAQSAMFQASFNMLGAISHKGVISPFSEDADGLLPSEGGGVLVLKTLKKAQEDKDRIYAVIKSSAIFSDGAGVSVMAPNTEGQQRTLSKAWEKADLNPYEIGLIEAHGTATIAGDKVEINTLNDFFGKDKQLNDIWLGSVKSNIGHTMPAAGMAGIIKVALALHNRQIPPTLHAENPAKALLDSRFKLPQTAIAWDENKYPLVAGVNAFGFGGINSHVIMTAYDNEPENLVVPPKITIKRSFRRAYVIGAETKEELLAKIDNRYFFGAKGKYKLVIFDPTDERLEKAKSIVAKDKPWKGRLDIWFSNKPVLENGGKLAFLFSGFNMEMGVELDTIANYFDLKAPHDVAEQGILNHSLKLYQTSNLLDSSLKKLGVKPDMNAGHSIGEWHAGKASGMISESNVNAMMEAWVKDLDQEIDEDSDGPDDNYDSNFGDVYFVAVGCGYQVLEPIIKGIPELHLSNDNCNNQVLMCGRREAIDEMCKRLRKEQIYNQELPYKSGYHTPFIKEHLGILDYCLNQIEELREPTIPLWSATSLEEYPTQMDEYKKLTTEHLTSHIRFRELIEKLYHQEKARVFVQIGAGPLNGFVDDILMGKDYSVISTFNAKKTGIEQLRRVLALLYIEGKEVDTLFINNGDIAKVPGQDFELDTFASVVTDFPHIKEVLKKQGGINFAALEENTDGKLLSQKVNENMREMSLAQKEMLDIMNEVKTLEQQFNFSSNQSIPQIARTNTPKKEEQTKQNKPAEKANQSSKKFQEELVVSTKNYPYVVDHTVVKQPQNWSVIDDLDVVIPMTMSIELMMEIAEKQTKSKKVIGVSSFNVYQWMNVFDEFKLQTAGEWITDERIKLEMKNFISTEINLSNQYPTPPTKYAGEINLGKEIKTPPTVEEIYRDIMFHGPQYQSVLKVNSFNEHGLKATVKHAGGKGSLLDTLGQLIAVYLKKVETKNNVSFPVKVEKITFYQDFHDQEGLFDFTLILHEINDEFIEGDMVLKRNGKLWCVAEKWLSRRIELDQKLWDVINAPLANVLAKNISETPVKYFDMAYAKTASWQFVEKRYLNQEEKTHYKNLFLNKRRAYLISRVAIKDAIRAYISDKYSKSCYPIEVSIAHDSKGKPMAKGFAELDNLHISLAHKENESVAIASDKPVGIDVEKIAERTADFMEIAFTPKEQALLANKDQAEWTTRFWAAKEAYGKMLGLGLEGNPQNYEVEKIVDDCLFINKHKIQTIKHKDNYIVAWVYQQ